MEVMLKEEKKLFSEAGICFLEAICVLPELSDGKKAEKTNLFIRNSALLFSPARKRPQEPKKSTMRRQATLGGASRTARSVFRSAPASRKKTNRGLFPACGY